MPGFVSMGDEWGSTKEASAAPEGKYDLRVVDVVEYLSQAGSKSNRAKIEFVGKPEFAKFDHYLPMIDREKDLKKDEERGNEPGTTAKNKILMVKRMLHAFGVKWDKNGYDPNRLVGKTARLEVQLEIPDDSSPANARPRNSLRLPYLPDNVA